MFSANEQKNEECHAFRIAPAVIHQVMDPFLHVSVIKQSHMSFARPQAGYISFFWVCDESKGGLIVETGTVGRRLIPAGSVGAIFCGNGVLCRTKPEKSVVHYLQVDIKIPMQKELLDAHWISCIDDGHGGYTVPDCEPFFYVGLRKDKPKFWDKRIQFIGLYSGEMWSKEVINTLP